MFTTVRILTSTHCENTVEAHIDEENTVYIYIFIYMHLLYLEGFRVHVYANTYMNTFDVYM